MVRKTGFRIQDSGFRLMLTGVMLLLAPGIRPPGPALAQVAAGTPTYNVNAKWVTDKGSQVYNVKAYGAMGDGATDDTAAIQTALNLVCGNPGVSSGTGNVYFPVGDYKITSTLYCYEGAGGIGHPSRISGAVGGGIAALGSVIDWRGPSGGTMMVLMGWREGVMENLIFEGNGTAQYGVVVSAVNVVNTTLGTAVTSPGSATVTPASMANIVAPSGQYPGSILNVDTGSNFEVVFVTAVTSSTFTATFTKTHLATAPIGNSGDTGGDLLESVSVLDASYGTYSAAFLVGQVVDADLAGVHFDHCYAAMSNNATVGYAGLLFVQGANVMNFSWKKGWFWGFQHGIDASAYFGYLDVDDTNFEGDTVSDLYLVNGNSTQYKVSSIRTELASGAAFVTVAGATSNPGSLEIDNSSINTTGNAPPNDCLVIWDGGMTIRGSTFSAPSGHVAKICANANPFQSSNLWGGVTLIGNQFQGVTSGFPPVYNTTGSTLFPANASAAVYAFMNWGANSAWNPTYRLSDYQPVGTLADESQASVSSNAVLNGGDTSVLLGFRNHANNADLNGVSKNSSDVVLLGGTPGVSASQYSATVTTGTPPLSVTSTTPVANLTVQNCDTCNITTSMTVGGGTALHAMNLYSTASITPTAVTASSCSDQTFVVSGLLATDRVSSIAPPSVLGNLSLGGYASAANTVLFHFCNPSSSPVTPPAGVYSFLAVH
jgi:hypothetical protein